MSPKASVGGRGVGEVCWAQAGLQGVADGFLADDRPHCPLSLQETRGDEGICKFRLENTDYKRYQ